MGRRSQIEDRNAEFCKAVANKDVTTLGKFYEDGARLLAPGAPMAEGRTAIQASLQALIDGGIQALTLDVVDVIDDKDISVDIGRYTLTVQPPGAEPVIDDGKYLVVWRQQADGGLKIAADTFNSDAPAQ